ncbi:hypothetical protein O6P43_014918 [Quillaja saponaria]|uniref:Uncharacterized protein n=1 Tax=Quillaja saponaria TaxID=32244 RepID=A0AAD7LW82_QUISA|nr:hypothetical protein O6P43_014918 [Quillaja saponaria]
MGFLMETRRTAATANLKTELVDAHKLLALLTAALQTSGTGNDGVWLLAAGTENDGRRLPQAGTGVWERCSGSGKERANQRSRARSHSRRLLGFGTKKSQSQTSGIRNNEVTVADSSSGIGNDEVTVADFCPAGTENDGCLLPWVGTGFGNDAQAVETGKN